MGQVIELRSHPANPTMVATARKILDMAERGLMTTMIHIGAGPNGEAAMGICGEFAEDLEYATEACSEGFSLLVGHKIEQQKADLIAMVPPRLRRGKA